MTAYPTTMAGPEPRPTTGTPVPVRGVRRPPVLLAASAAVAVVLLVPLVFLVIEASGAGWSTVVHLIFRPLTGTLLWNTIRLTVVVTVLCAVIGTLAAWCVERTDLPGRRIWAVLVVVPFAIPDFVVSFGWASLSTWVHGFRGAVLVMTLAVYPLVYLPVAASLRGADPDQEDVARSLGSSRLSTFFRITVRQARSAILGGCLLVALVMLAEYGAFEILGYQTFTTEIFTESQELFNVPASCALVFVLVLLGLVVLGAEAMTRDKGRISRLGPQVQRVTQRHRLGKATVPVLFGFFALVGLALGVPVGSCIYWTFEGGAHALTGASIASATWHTALYSGTAAALATLMALPVALLAVRNPGRSVHLLERSTYLVLAMPGIVIAFALSYFTERYADSFFYQSAPLLILAYAILFFPLALVGVKASVAHAPVGLEEVARSLGLTRLAVLRRVTLPLIGPGLAAAFSLVLLAAVTELTATLILVPTGVQTLSTQFWAYQQNLSYGQAAPFALVIIAIAAVPSYVLGRYFDRLPARATST
ncbi:MAG: iron ABC transporter permease [Acidimicrobiales bacterium]